MVTLRQCEIYLPDENRLDIAGLDIEGCTNATKSNNLEPLN